MFKVPREEIVEENQREGGGEERREGEREREGRMGFLIILRAVTLSFEESPKY